MTSTSSYISGWDIGGAHIKVARCNPKGQLIKIIQVSCPLWQGINQLERAITSALSQLNNKADQHAITMTGELVDIFSHRQQGVIDILSCFNKYIDAGSTSVYASGTQWLSPRQAALQWHSVASQNWQASANLVAQYQNQGLFIDIGSTTCDIIPFYQNKAQPQGTDDLQRQASRELLYTGAIRTPLIAISQTAPFKGELLGLASEVFATSADVWCLLEQLNPDSIQDISADGQPWQKEYCACRIARLSGTDFNQASMMQWQQLAQWFAQQQIHQITQAILHVISSQTSLSPHAPIVGAGIGRFIAKRCADRLDRPYQDFTQTIGVLNESAADHAPASAIALLAHNKLS